MTAFRKKLHRKPQHAPHPLLRLGAMLGGPVPAPFMAPAGRRFDGALSFLAYLALVLLMWAPHTATTGMPYETEFITSSDTRSLLRAFFYWMDGMRAFT